MNAQHPPETPLRTEEQMHVEMAREFYSFALHFYEASKILSEIMALYRDKSPKDDTTPSSVPPCITPEPDCATQSTQVHQDITLTAEPVANVMAGPAPPDVADVYKAESTLADGVSAEITIREVRHQITKAAQAGYADEIKSLLAQHGAVKVSDVNPSHYCDLLRAVDDLMKLEVNING